MIIENKSLSLIYTSIILLNKALLFFSFLVIVVFLGTFFKVSQPEMVINRKDKQTEEIISKVDYNVIGTGFLGLKSEVQSFPIPNLSDEIFFLGKNSRPDANVHDIKVHLGFKGDEKTIKIAPEKKLYLSYNINHLTYSDESTPLWIKPYLDKKGEVWLEMGITLNSKSGEPLLDEVYKCKLEKGLSKKLIEPSQNLLLIEGLKEMEKATWWAPDLLFSGYGGADYEHLIGKNRLEFSSKKKGYVLYVEEQDTLIWKDGKWQQGQNTQDYPIARLTVLSPYKMEWDLWDKSGFEQATISLEKEKVNSINLKIKDIFSRVRQRTYSRISCRIDNKATILKKGDWMIRYPSRWHILKSLEEMEEVLVFKTKGELFIFDGIEKIDGQSNLCGTLFDPMRTQMQIVQLPLIQTKIEEYSSPIKKPISTNIQPPNAVDQGSITQKHKRLRKKTRQKTEPTDRYIEE